MEGKGRREGKDSRKFGFKKRNASNANATGKNSPQAPDFCRWGASRRK
jgi:hypothetical protein